MYINVHKRFLKFFYASFLKNLPGIRIHEKHVEKVRSLHSMQRRLFKRTKIFLVTHSTCSQENAVHIPANSSVSSSSSKPDNGNSGIFVALETMARAFPRPLQRNTKVVAILLLHISVTPTYCIPFRTP